MPKEFEVMRKMFKCENCGAVFGDDDSQFDTCKICGQEVCTQCGEKVELWNAKLNDWQDNILVHETCRRNHEVWQNVYISAIKYLQNEFYNKIDELNKDYLSEYMHKWCDILEAKENNNEI